MAKILLIETATEVCSVAVAADGQLLALAEETDQPNHAARLTLLIDQCTREAGIALAGLDAVALSSGPGSYTALRVGASVAKGICYALDKPLLAIDTLQALAAGSRAEAGASVSASTRFVPMLDARRNEVWTAVYDADLRALVTAQPLILEHNMFEDFVRSVPGTDASCVFVVAGNGAKKMRAESFGQNMVVSTVQKCSAKYFCVLAEQFFQRADFQDVSYFEPFYMKSPNITTSNKPLF